LGGWLFPKVQRAWICPVNLGNSGKKALLIKVLLERRRNLELIFGNPLIGGTLF